MLPQWIPDRNSIIFVDMTDNCLLHKFIIQENALTVPGISDKRVLIMYKYSTGFSVLIFLLLISFGCQKKGEGIQSGESEGSTEESRPALDKITMNRSGEAENTEKEEEPVKKEKESIETFSGPLFLQQILPRSRVLPDGDYCGPFMDFMSTDTDENRAGTVLRNFFHTYRAGVIDFRYLYEDMNVFFREELEMFKPRCGEIVGYLAGSFKTSANRGSVRIRLYSETGSITGILYLIYLDENWYVEDWELPISLWPGSLPLTPSEGEGLEMKNAPLDSARGAE